MYVMSRCRFAVQAIDTVSRLVGDLDGRLQLRLEYIVEEKDGRFFTLHGDREIQGNITQLCAMANFPDQRRWLDFVVCQGRSWRDIPQNWRACAKEAGLDLPVMRGCIEGANGRTLLRGSMKRTWEARALASPTVDLAGQRHRGATTRAELLQALCPHLRPNPPRVCQQLPPEPAVKLTVIGDRRCGKRCDTDRLVQILRTKHFPRLDLRRLDYSDPAGKALFKKLDLGRLPALLFNEDIEKSNKYNKLSKWLVPRGEYVQLLGPASFDPEAEICDNGIDDTGNGKVDCADAGCRGQVICRPEKMARLDLFVMSKCPYGVKALEAARRLLANFAGGLDLDVHYIATATPDGFSALHGQSEVDENIRQLCAKKIYRKKNKYLDYVWCRNKALGSPNWRACATGDIRAAAIRRCARGRLGTKLLAADIKLAQGLGVSASPTWLANNRHLFNGIDAETVKNALCRHNPKLVGCDRTLDEPSGEGEGGACGR